MGLWEIQSQVRNRLKLERGTLYKQADLRIALCYPSPYPVGMSSLGYQTIYREIHLHEGATAERAFLPDDLDSDAAVQVPIFTYETETPLSDFPIIAFSMAYELEITGLFEMLERSGIPPLREARDERHPFVVVGGPITNSNPAPLAPFADLIVLGEAEELIHELLEVARGLSRREWSHCLAGRRGFFAPGLSAALPAIAKASDHCLPARSQIITADTVLSSMFLIEPERGCSRGCTYCVMRRTTNGGMRRVSPAVVLAHVPEVARRVGLVGAAVTDHPQIKEIVRRIVDSGRGVGISSLRADRLDEEFVGLLARGGYRTLTTASDGASQQLRDLVDRKTSEQHLLKAAQLAARFGMRRLKIYELIGLPGESDRDIDEMARFTAELSRIVPVSLGISPFVAKRHTPLDGMPYESVTTLEHRLSRLRASLQGKVEVRPTSARWGWVEYMLAQGDASAGLAALDAWRAGGSYAAWKRAFRQREIRFRTPEPIEDGRRHPPDLSHLKRR